MRRYALDSRSLALLRIAVGLGFALVRIINIPNVVEFYTDQGSFPRACTVIFSPISIGLDLFDCVGGRLGVFVLYGLTILAGLAVAAGYRTRTSTFICWVLGFSLFNRCPYVNPASDAEVLFCLFFGLFLPWGNTWSWDHPRSEPRAYLTAATWAWRLQVSAIYVTAAFMKTDVQWASGTATLIAMKSDFWSSAFGRALGELLTPHAALVSHLTDTVVWAEFLLPLLLLLPFVEAQVLALIGLVALHTGFGLCLHLEAFSPLGIACLVGFLPAAFWRRFPGLERGLERVFNRHRACEHPRSSGLDPFSSAFLTWAMLGIVWTCASSVGRSPVWLSPRAGSVWRTFGLQEGWGMFVPVPFRGGWYVFRGLTERGDWVDLEMEGAADSLEMPRGIDQTLPSSRHILLYNTELFTSDLMKGVQERVADDFRQRWERRHPGALDRLQRMEIYKFYREYDADAGTFTKPEKRFTYTWPAPPAKPAL